RVTQEPVERGPAALRLADHARMRRERAISDITGTGIAFPLRVDAHGGVALSRDERDVEEAIAVVVDTARGERPMRPEFGCGIHDYVFEAIDAYTVGRLDHEIRLALQRWEPRIDALDVGIDP